MIGAVYKKPFDGGMVGDRGTDVKAEFLAAVADPPSCTRVEKGGLGARRKVWKLLNIDVDVWTTATYSKRLVLSTQDYGGTIACSDPQEHSPDSQVPRRRS